MVDSTFTPTGGSPSRAVMYFLLLKDGRLLWLDGAAPAAEDGFPALMAAFARSLSQP